MKHLDCQKLGQVFKNDFIIYLNRIHCAEITPLTDLIEFPFSFSTLSLLMTPVHSADLDKRSTIGTFCSE